MIYWEKPMNMRKISHLASQYNQIGIVLHLNFVTICEIGRPIRLPVSNHQIFKHSYNKSFIRLILSKCRCFISNVDIENRNVNQDRVIFIQTKLKNK